MNRNLVIAIIVLVLGAGFLVVLSMTRQSAVPVTPQPTIPPTSTPTPTPRELRVPLSELRTSGESGIATITEQNGKLTVSLLMTGAPSGVSQPVHIHTGKCPTPGAVKYPLSLLIDGRSDTTLQEVATINDLLKQLPLAINVHKSAASPTIYVACGNIVPEGSSGQEMPTVTEGAQESPAITKSTQLTPTPTVSSRSSATPTTKSTLTP